MSDVEQKPEEIQSLESIIFDHTDKEDFEPRLRMFVACIRGDRSKLPKKYYTDIIERIFAEAGYVKPTHQAKAKPVDGELPSIIELMVEIRKYWTTASGEPELKEFAEYVRGIISAHLQAAVRAARLDEHDKVTEKYIAMIEGRKDQLEEQLHG